MKKNEMRAAGRGNGNRVGTCRIGGRNVREREQLEG